MTHRPIFAILCGLTVLATTANAKELPVESFFRAPDKKSITLSPDGSKVSWLEPWEEGSRRANIMIAPIDDPTKGKRVTTMEYSDITNYSWVNNDTLAYYNPEVSMVYLAKADGSGERSVSDLLGRSGITYSWINDGLPNDSNHMLLEIESRYNGQWVWDLAKVDLNTGDIVSYDQNRNRFEYWGVADNNGDIRTAIGYDGSDTIIYYKPSPTAAFDPLFTYDFRHEIKVLGFTPDNKRMYLLSNEDSDKKQLFEYDPQTKTKKLLYKNDDYDLAGIKYHRGTLTGVSWTGVGYEEAYLTDDRKDLFARLASHIPDRKLMLTGLSDDQRYALVKAWDDRDPGTFYTYDRQKDKLTLVEKQSSWLDRDSLAQMQPFTYKARDGLEIPGYLMLPPGKEDAKNLPLVVYVHGGPEQREEQVYIDEFQIFPNRGYALFIPNFRGSTGYGKAFWEAGFKQWGLKMLDDVTDGTKYLIEKGIADPNRIAIFGVSYGGHAALMSAVREPDLYKAVISWVGVTDMVKMLENMPQSWRLAQDKIYATKGDLDKDRAYLVENSPINHVKDIKAPLFIAYGGKDRQVRPQETDAFIKAFKEAGGDVTVLYREDEGHNFVKEENRIALFDAITKFLAPKVPVLPTDGKEKRQPGADPFNPTPVSDGNIVVTPGPKGTLKDSGLSLNPNVRVQSLTTDLLVARQALIEDLTAGTITAAKIQAGLKGPEMTEEGLNMKGTQLWGLPEASRDDSPVTLGQLRKLMNQDSLTQVKEESDRNAALTAALSAMQAPDYHPLRPTSVTAGFGFKGAQKAIALGLVHYINADTLVNAGLSHSGSESLWRGGLTMRLGPKENLIATDNAQMATQLQEALHKINALEEQLKKLSPSQQ